MYEVDESVAMVVVADMPDCDDDGIGIVTDEVTISATELALVLAVV